MSADAHPHVVPKIHCSRRRRRASHRHPDSCGRFAGPRACAVALRLLDLDRGRIVLQMTS